MRMALPAAARHPYALACYQEKEILLSASRYTNKQISNLHTVLADGRTYRSGSHALPMAEEHGVNWREDGGRISPASCSARETSWPREGSVCRWRGPETLDLARIFHMKRKDSNLVLLQYALESRKPAMRYFRGRESIAGMSAPEEADGGITVQNIRIDGLSSAMYALYSSAGR